MTQGSDTEMPRDSLPTPFNCTKELAYTRALQYTLRLQIVVSCHTCLCDVGGAMLSFSSLLLNVTVSCVGSLLVVPKGITTVAPGLLLIPTLPYNREWPPARYTDVSCTLVGMKIVLYRKSTVRTQSYGFTPVL